MNSAKIVFVLLLLAGMFLPSRVVRADIAPPPAPQLGGLEPFEYQDTNVQMVYERVEMEIQSFVPSEDETFPQSRVNTTAYFSMRNQGDTSESMQAIFPLESFSNCRLGFGGGNSYTSYFVNAGSFQVLVNGASVPVKKVVTDHPDQNLQGLGDACKQMTWAGFDVAFPPDEDVVIRVEYAMETQGVDFMQNIEYILETGAGWAGPIRRGYVIVKFPYSASAENVLPESTPGYQFLYNEVFWSFENLEPTSNDNIQVSIVSPDTWQKIVSLRQALKENPGQPEKWLDLAQTYFDIATWHWDIIRSHQYLQQIAPVYETGIANNPNNAELHAKYAEFKLYQWSPHALGQIPEDQALPILSLLNRALALESDNETANMNLSILRSAAPFITFTPPATIRPSVTSLLTATASITPTVTKTTAPSERLTSTEAPTGPAKDPESTSTPRPTATNIAKTVTDTVAPTSDSSEEKETGNQSLRSIAIVGMAATFIGGIVIGILWSTWRKR